MTTALVADADRRRVEALSAGLLDHGVGRVLQAESVGGVDEIIDGRLVGDLALVSAAFGGDTDRLIRGLRAVGWPRVIVLATVTDSGPLVAAVRAGAGGVLYRPAAASTCADAAPAGVRGVDCRRPLQPVDR